MLAGNGTFSWAGRKSAQGFVKTGVFCVAWMRLRMAQAGWLVARMNPDKSKVAPKARPHVTSLLTRGRSIGTVETTLEYGKITQVHIVVVVEVRGY